MKREIAGNTTDFPPSQISHQKCDKLSRRKRHSKKGDQISLDERRGRKSRRGGKKA